jgi:hypothetical protein
VEYKVTKVYLVEAADRRDAKRRIAADGAAHLQVISIQELKALGEWPRAERVAHATIADHGDIPEYAG